MQMLKSSINVDFICQFLFLKKDEEKFVEYLRKEIGVENSYSTAANKRLYEWSLHYI
jgi:hypothetical protein